MAPYLRDLGGVQPISSSFDTGVNRYAVDAWVEGYAQAAQRAGLLDAAQRELMQQAFATQVFNQYGCREVPNIAWECRHGGLHVFSDMV